MLVFLCPFFQAFFLVIDGKAVNGLFFRGDADIKCNSHFFFPL